MFIFYIGKKLILAFVFITVEFKQDIIQNSG